LRANPPLIDCDSSDDDRAEQNIFKLIGKA
jgi:hypothetical protein